MQEDVEGNAPARNLAIRSSVSADKDVRVGGGRDSFAAARERFLLVVIFAVLRRGGMLSEDRREGRKAGGTGAF